MQRKIQEDLSREFSTPMMQQYIQIKREYADCILFFRLGDFYELFLNDAIIGADILNITLTARPRGRDGDVPMAGVPFHAAEQYLAQLVKAGYKVAICEQVSDPDAKGIVDREVVRIVTPGTMVSESALDKKNHNHIVSIVLNEFSIGVAVADVSTGKFIATQADFKSQQELEHFLMRELLRFRPSECILSLTDYENNWLLKKLRAVQGMNIFIFQNWGQYVSDAERFLKKQLQVASLRGFGIASKQLAKVAASALFGYLKETQQSSIPHITGIKSYKPEDFVLLDKSTITNLELFQTLREGEHKGSLFSVLDHTVSAAGGRLLKDWILHPLKSKKKITDRLQGVDEFLHNRKLRESVRDACASVYDIERIVAKLALGVANPGDVRNLYISLEQALALKKSLQAFSSPILKKLELQIDSKIKNVIELIDSKILPEPKIDMRSGGIIAEGVSERLDELRKISGSGKAWIKEFQAQQREETGISNLKVKYNKVFGYYIEVSKSHISSVPNSYERKQTLVNAERFITHELKKYEQEILTAQEEIGVLEFELFQQVVSQLIEFTTVLQKTASAIAATDVLSSFSLVAEKYRYTQPKIVAASEPTEIKKGRHPVIEHVLEDAQFVPNDLKLNSTDHQMILITGPNMAGKSVYMRQTALIVLLAHIGCYVPAQSAQISLVDRIFVRSGASDMITSGLSTFMVEMVETAHILHHASEKSLIIMDEIGRGTSTYDGISIAWAVAEFLVKSEQKPKTLFATHYHELQKLADEYPDRIKNYQMAIADKDGEPVFLHTVVPGGASHSFGVAVARLAGVPKQVTQRAVELLHSIEEQVFGTEKSQPHVSKRNENEIISALLSLDLDVLSPLEVQQKISRLQKQAREQKNNE